MNLIVPEWLPFSGRLHADLFEVIPPPFCNYSHISLHSDCLSDFLEDIDMVDSKPGSFTFSCQWGNLTMFESILDELSIHFKHSASLVDLNISFTVDHMYPDDFSHWPSFQSACRRLTRRASKRGPSDTTISLYVKGHCTIMICECDG